MNAIIPEKLREPFLMIHTQRWTNIGLTIAFLGAALFTFIFINTGIANWWNDLTDSMIVSIIIDLLLFIPVAFLLCLCIIANEHFNSITIRILLLICFSFLTSIFLVLVVCSGSEISKICSTYSIGIFLFYTLITMFALFALDVILMPFIHISASLHAIPTIKTIISLPFVFIIWSITHIGWVWLISLQVFIFYMFYSARVSMTWAKISKLYIGYYTYKSSKKKVNTYNINMFKFNNYKKLGLYLSLYNFLPNIFIVLNESVNSIESVTDPIEAQQEKDENSILDFMCYDNCKNEDEEKQNYIPGVTAFNKAYTIPHNIFDKKVTLYRIFKGVLFYIFFCFVLYYMGNLFIFAI